MKKEGRDFLSYLDLSESQGTQRASRCIGKLVRVKNGKLVVSRVVMG